MSALLLAIAGTLLAIVVLWGTLIEPRWYALREFTVAVLPPGSAPIRLLHLSDLHMAPWQRRKQRWIAGLVRLEPDLVVSTGDLLGHRDAFEAVERALEPFRGTPGAFVHGSNDYFGPLLKNPFGYLAGPSRESSRSVPLNTARLTEWLTGLGWFDLNNAAGQFVAASTRVAGVGLDDPHLNRDRLDVIPSRAEWAGPSDLRIGVSHAPYRRVLDAFTEAGADLILAGHTHGGQVRLPNFLGGALVTNCDLPRSYARGLRRWTTRAHACALHVSAGLGTSIFAPIRLCCRPEASLLTLVARPD